MKKTVQTISLYLIAFISIISCTNETLKPADKSDIPSNIIVKEKSISGNFDSVVANLTVFSHSDSVFLDSIYDNIGNIGIHVNTSRFAQSRFIYFGNNSDLREFDGDSLTSAFLFDDNNRISWIYDQYSVNYKYPYPLSSEISFKYDNQNRIETVPTYGFRNFGGGCDIQLEGRSGNFYTTTNGMDSLVLTFESPSCGMCPYCTDTVIVTFLNTPNNTNLATLSFPSIPSNSKASSNYFMLLMQYLPFPKLNGKLIDKVYYSNFSTGNLSYTNSYTFDAEGRVKTAKIAYNYIYNTLKEKLIEFNY